MNQGAVLHKGLLSDCKVCNSTTETQEKRTRKARSKTGVSLDVVIRRQVASDLGEDEPQKDERFQLLQKYGVAAPRIDRLATKPSWMGVAEWKRKQNEWFKVTKGMIQPQQQRRTFPNLPASRVVPYPKKFRVNSQSNLPRDTRGFRKNFGQTRTATLPS